jgi:signal transduction histidine kinase
MKRSETDPEDDFYGAIVSELRQPLTTISGTAQLAKRLMKTDPDGATEALEQLVKQVGRINLLIAEIRDRARDAEHVEALFRK